MDTFRSVTLSQHLGTLTSGRVVPLSQYKLTPVPLTAHRLRRRHVRSSTRGREVSLPKLLIGALPHRRPRVRSGCDQSRVELAIRGLDWTITPYTQVNGMICTSKTGRPSTPVSRGFGLPTYRSTAFKFPSRDSPRAHGAPRCLRSCGRVAFATAPSLSLLASPRDRTPWSVFQHVRQDIAPLACASFVAFMPWQSVAAWFQVLFTSRQGCFAAFAHATTALSVSSRI